MEKCIMIFLKYLYKNEFLVKKKIKGIISNGLDLDECYPGHDSEQQKVLAIS